MRVFKTGFVGVACSACLALFAAPANAAQPVVQACVGTTFSQAAAALPGGQLGQIVVGFAQDPNSPPGLGDGIQALQAGQVPDDAAVNTCNDS